MHGIFYGGASRSLFHLIKNLDKEIFEIVIYTISCDSEEIKQDFLKYVEKIQFVNLSTISVNQVYQNSLLHYYKNRNKSCKNFVEKLVNDNIHILHINTSVFPQIPQWVKKNSRIKVITHVREWLSPLTKGIIQDYMIKKISESSDEIIAISDNEAQLFYHCRDKLHIIPNPFNFNIIKNVKDNYRIHNDMSKEIILVTMLSHFSIKKGHLNFLAALKEIINNKMTNYPVMFLIVGFKDKRTWWKLLIKKLLFKSDYTSKVLHYIRKNNLSKFVKLIPYTNDVFTIIKASNIIVRPADSADPWGRDIIEAMALKKSLVATGTSEFFIENDKTGYLVSPKNSKELAKKISVLINDKNKRMLFGENAYIKIKKMCDIELYEKKLLSIYKSLI